MQLETARALDPHEAEREADLIRRIGEGDRQALAELYRAYRGRLHRFIGRLTPRSDVIDEAINDCLWVVWKKASGFRGDSRVSTWIFGIAYRCTLKAFRRHDSNGAADVSMEADAAVYHPQQADELRDLVAKGLERLSDSQRVVLELAYSEGHSVEEIAAILDCPVGTVKARMFHARLKLKNLLPMLGGERPAARAKGMR